MKEYFSIVSDFLAFKYHGDVRCNSGILLASFCLQQGTSLYYFGHGVSTHKLLLPSQTSLLLLRVFAMLKATNNATY